MCSTINLAITLDDSAWLGNSPLHAISEPSLCDHGLGDVDGDRIAAQLTQTSGWRCRFFIEFVGFQRWERLAVINKCCKSEASRSTNLLSMRFLLVSLCLFLTSVVAQCIHIDSPSSGETLRAGEQFTAKLSQTNSLSSFQQISIVIGLWHCPYPNCNNDNYLGDILYQGPYNPSLGTGGFFQNFTLIVPAGEIKGEASLHVAQFYTVGVSHLPLLTVTGVNITVV